MPLSWTLSPSLGRPARRHSVVRVFTTRPPRAVPLGFARLHHSAAPRGATRFCTSSPLGRPARRHSVAHVFITRPPRASPLGCVRLHHSAAPRIATWFCTSSPLARPARRHSVLTRPRPSAASRVTISWTCLYLYTPSTGTAKLLIWSNLISHSVASLPPSSITRGLRAAVGHVTLRGYAHLVNLLITSGIFF